MQTRRHDLAIIGTGSGNSLIGPELGELDIGLVEGGTFGGTCLNVGCIPTKMFVHPANLAEDGAHAGPLGVTFGRPSTDWTGIRDRIFGRIDPISSDGERYREDQPNVTLYRARARFVGPMTLDTGTGVTITADRWVIAAGGRPTGLELPGLEGANPDRGVHTSDTIMRVATPPGRVVIIGGGFVAAELAHVLDALGSEVTWVHRGPCLLRPEDTSIREAFTQIARQRFDLRLETVVGHAAYRGREWVLDLKGPTGTQTVTADAVLLAVGRVPNTDVLDVGTGGLPTHPDGRLVVDEFQRTPIEGVWALGDISSEYQLKHVANHEMRVVRHNLTHPGQLVASDHRFVPHAVFSHPQIAAFGRTEQELRAAGTPYLRHVQRYGDVAYGWAMEDTTGIVKVLVDPESRLLLGAHLLGYQASSLIQPLIQAAAFGQPAGQVARGQYWIHPALSEVIENALLGVA